MCPMWADGYNSLMRHFKLRCNFMVLIAGDPKRFAGVVEARGWDELRVVSDGK